MNVLLLQLGRTLLRAALDESLRRALPLIYRRLDTELPLMLTNNAPPQRVKGAIARAITDTLGGRATPAHIETVIALYDPIQAARRNLQR